MPSRVYHIYGTATAAANDVAHIDITRPCILRKVLWHVTPQSAASGDTMRFELSTAAAAVGTTNNPLGIISEVVTGGTLTTSGSFNAVNLIDAGFNLQLRLGDRLYVHCAVKTGSGTGVVSCNFTVDE